MLAKGIAALGEQARPRRIVFIDDEPWIGEMVEDLIHRQFSAVTILRFENRDAAWRELLRADPDLLITDMNSDNVPGRCEYLGMSGWEMLPLLAEREVRYPILVVSGSFLMPGVESRARKCAGPKLDVTLLTKPFSADFFRQELNRLLNGGDNGGRRFPAGET